MIGIAGKRDDAAAAEANGKRVDAATPMVSNWSSRCILFLNTER